MVDTLSKALGGKQNGEQWEWGVGDKKRLKQETERKKERKKVRQKEKRNLNHARLLWSQRVSISIPTRPPAWPPGSGCVYVRQTSVCFGQRARRCVCRRTLACRGSSPSRSESTWDEGHMQKNTHLVIKQFLSRGFSQNPSQIWVTEGERGLVTSENKGKNWQHHNAAPF